MNRVDFERKFWDEKAMADDVDREMHDPWLSTDEEVKIIIKAMPKGAKGVLEIGCGVGRLGIPIAKKFPESTIIGIDISMKLIDIATSRGADLNNFWLFPTKGRGIPDPRKLIGKKYGFIYSVTVFQHLPFLGVYAYIVEAGEKLKKGGVFMFQFIEGDEHEPMSNHFRLKAITESLDWAGLEVIKCDKGLIHKKWTWITARKL